MAHPSRRLSLLAVLILLTASLALACDDEADRAGGDQVGDVDSGADAGEGGDADDVEDNNDGEPDADGEDEPQEERGELVIAPQDAVLETSAAEASPTLTFEAFRESASGERQPVAAEWRLSSTELGGIELESGLFSAQAGATGRVEVIASEGGEEASTTLRVETSELWLDDGVSDSDVEAMRSASDSDEDGPELLYPEDGTRFFQNIKGVALQWGESGEGLFRVVFSAAGRFTFEAYTRASIWTPPEHLWLRLIRELSGDAVTVRVDALGGDGGVRRGRNTVTFSFSSDVVQGALYYWSTTDSGIMRLPVGETAPERFFTPGTPPGSPCVGCHSVSRDGKRMAFNTAPIGLPLGPLMEISTDDPTNRIIDIPQDIQGMQPTFSPDGLRIVSGWEGRLTERWSDPRCVDDTSILCEQDSDCAGGECRSGEPIQTLPPVGDLKPGFPDWSPDDRYLVAAATRSGFGVSIDFEMTQGGLVLFERDGEAWRNPTVILEPPGDMSTNNTHPAFSPDSRWIAWSHTGSGLTDIHGNVVQSDLWLMSPSTRVPVPLSRANKRSGLANNWPKWAPFEGEHLWVAFSSQRSYGKVDTPGGPQIWIAAIDPSLASQGEDPSFPAFWLPYQDTASGNHIPYWAIFVKEPN